MFLYGREHDLLGKHESHPEWYIWDNLLFLCLCLVVLPRNS